jgi:hypothetical protein
VARAIIRACYTPATSTFKSRKALALTSRAVTNSFIGAFTVKVCFVPTVDVVCASKTVTDVVLFSLQPVSILVVNLLISVDLVVGIDVPQTTVNEGSSKIAKTVGAIVTEEV